jgi:hypothetical protein
LLVITQQYPELTTIKLTDSKQFLDAKLLSGYPFLLDFLRMFPLSQHPYFRSSLAAVLKYCNIDRHLSTLTRIQKESLFFKLCILTSYLLLLDQTREMAQYRHFDHETRIILFKTLLIINPKLATKERINVFLNLCKYTNSSKKNIVITLTAVLNNANPIFITYDGLGMLWDCCKDKDWSVRQAAIQGLTTLLPANPTFLTQ